MTEIPPDNTASDSLNRNADNSRLSQWSYDFDNTVIEFDDKRPEGRFRLKGRCKRCWGGLIGKGHGDGHVPLEIRCRVCGQRLEGDKAEDEFKRKHEIIASKLLLPLKYGLPLNYEYPDRANFVWKFFPYIERRTKNELTQLVNQQPRKNLATLL